MDFSNELWVRVYKRDTISLKLLSWQARALLWELIRKADRSGVIEMGTYGAAGLAVLVSMPADVVEPALASLISAGTVVVNDGFLVLPRYQEAQETPQSDALRQRELRVRRREQSIAGISETVTKSDETSRNVTDASRKVTKRHALSRAVTDGHASSRAVTKRREQNRTENKNLGEAPSAACAAPSNPADAADGSGGPQNPTAPAQAPSRSRKAAGTAAVGLLLPLPGPDNPQEKTAATAQPVASGEVSQKRTGPARKAPLPADWTPSPELCAMATGLGVDPQRAADSMRDWAAANAERKADWDATFRNWVRRDQQFKRAPVLPQPRVTRPYELPPPGQATPPSPPKKREPIPF